MLLQKMAVGETKAALLKVYSQLSKAEVSSLAAWIRFGMMPSGP